MIERNFRKNRYMIHQKWKICLGMVIMLIFRERETNETLG